MLLYVLELIGTVAFAASGVVLAFRLRLDAVGVFVLAAAVAIGGGTIRDIILNVPVFWLDDNNYLYSIMATCAVMIIFIKKPAKLPKQLLPLFDAMGLALFTIIGTEKTLTLGLSPLVAVLMGSITGCGGGVIRDTLGNSIPIIFQKEIYAMASIIGAALYCLMRAFNTPAQFALIIGGVVIMVIRVAALKWQLSLPNLYRNR